MSYQESAELSDKAFRVVISGQLVISMFTLEKPPALDLFIPIVKACPQR